jgi:hypothetical protein
MRLSDTSLAVDTASTSLAGTTARSFLRFLGVSARFPSCAEASDSVEVPTMKARILLLLVTGAAILAAIAGCVGSCPLTQ